MDFYQSQNVTRSVVHSGLSMSKTTGTSKIRVLVPQIPVSSITTLTVPFPLLHTYHRVSDPCEVEENPRFVLQMGCFREYIQVKYGLQYLMYSLEQ